MISIVTPIYNSAKYIADAVVSVKDQTYHYWQLILIDDCSTDESKNLIDVLAAEDERIVVLSTEKNSGPAHTRNIGIEYAISHGAEFIAFLDSDDTLEPNYLSSLLDVAETHNADIVWCNFSEYEFGHEERKRTIFHKLPSMGALEEKLLINCFFEERQGLGCLWNKLYRVKFVTHYNLRINEERVRAEDWEFNLMAFQCSPKVIAIDDALYNYIHYPRPSVMTTFREKDYSMYKRSLTLLTDIANKYGLQEKMKGRYANYLYNTIYYIVLAVLTNQESQLISKICADKLLRDVVADTSLYGCLTIKHKVYAFFIRCNFIVLLKSLIRIFK